MRLVIAAALAVAACGAEAPGLISTADIDGDTLPQALTDVPGETMRGEMIFSNRDAGHCVLCHAVAELDVEFQGDVGPALTTVGDRLSAAQLRLRVVDYQLVRRGALMPSYYRNHNLHQVEDKYRGETILSAQDIEDVVAYLGTLKAETDDE